MYSMKYEGYTHQFKFIYELVEDVIEKGIDPDHYITYNGMDLSQKVKDFIVE